MHLIALSVCIVILQAVNCVVDASAGDRSWSFSKCFHECQTVNCSDPGEFSTRQPVYLRMFGWDCDGECQYVCMWKTVNDFMKDGNQVPQFFGKWPFIRVYGVQEPASALFSLCNGLSHISMLMYFRSKVSSTAPMFYIWHLYALSNVNAWFWSTVFHIRDTDFTEMMDYLSAISMVFMSLIAGSFRLPPKRYKRYIAWPTAAAIITFFIYHVHYMAFVNFSYSYNMRVNVTAGILNAAAWICWSWQVRRRQHYVWKVVVSIILLFAMLLLELFDFPPLWWTFDAHSLWHLGTIPIPFLFYRFVVDDCLYQQTESRQLPATVDKKQL